MVVIRCTGKLRKRLKVAPNPEPPASTTRLGDWYVNLVNLGRKQFILAASEVTLLPVVLDAASGGVPLPVRLTVGLRSVLASIRVEERLALAELEAMSEATYAATANRSVLGCMNDFWNMLDAYWEPGADLTTVALQIARAPMGPLGMDSPREATVALFEAAKRASANDT